MSAKASDVNARKAIDHLACDLKTDGPILGMLSTTFELNPSFYEIDFLPGCLGLGAWDDRNWVSRIALEKELASMQSAHLFLDARRYRGRPRSFRVDVRPAVGAGNQLLHAKVSLLVQERAVRLLVGSNNLTEEGYRSNREVLLPLKVREGELAHGGLIREALAAMPARLGPWWTAASEALRQKALVVLDELGATDTTDAASFLWSGGSEPLWQQVLKQWPKGEVIRRINIVSPFWSEEGRSGPVESFLEALVQIGALANGAEIHLYAESTLGSAKAAVPRIPASLAALDIARFGIKGWAHATDPSVTPSEAGGRTDVLQRRALHAKIVMLEGAQTTLAYVGSANFTHHGWGFGGLRANIEAGVVLTRDTSAAGPLRRLVPPTIGDAVELGTGLIAAVEVPVEEAPSLWPSFLKELLLTPSDGEQLALEARVFEEAEAPEYSVWLALDGAEVELLRGKKATGTTRVALSPEILQRLLIEKEARVCWPDCPAGSQFPINLDEAARLEFPLGEGMGRPGERLLLAYYQGRISYEDLFPRPPDFEGEDGQAVADLADSEVDTSRIQSYQVREFVEALTGIEQDLRGAITGTETSLRLAILGPVSPIALARAVHGEVKQGRRSPTAGAFQLVEISAAIGRVARLVEDAEKRTLYARHARQANTELERLLAEVRANQDSTLGPGTSFDRYARTLLPSSGERR